ncbi:MAG TPA: TonB-dependent receptor [Mariniphaga sp.]|nr:TonB-dependent receptor [Mariniphaga sp.]
MRYLLLLLLHLIIPGITPAEEPNYPAMDNIIITGKVTSGSELVPFATVVIKGTTIGTAADASGNFKLADLPSGQHTIIISAIGYRTYYAQINLSGSHPINIKAELDPDNIGIEQIVVSADRNAKSRQVTPTLVNSIGPNLFLRTQSITLSEGLNFSPGIRMENNCQNCGFSQVRMNGLEGPYTQILINSRPVFSGLAGVYGLELIPANMIERVELIRGGGSALYGSNAIAGTVNLITKDPVSNTWSVEGSYSSIGTSFNNPSNDYNLNFNSSFISDNYRKGITVFGFHRKRNPFDANDDGFSELASIKNMTLGARVFQRVASRGKITLDYFYIDEFRRGGNKFNLPLHKADIAESVDHGIHSGAASFDLLMREADKLSLYFSSQKVNRDSYYGANQDPSAYGLTGDFTFSSGIQYIRQLKKLLVSPATITSGLELSGSYLKDSKLGYYDPETDVEHPDTEIANQQLSSKAAFLQSEWAGKKIVLTSGLRFDNYNVSDRSGKSEVVSGNVLSPRINLLFNPGHHWQIRTGFAKGFRAPQIFDEDLHIETSGSRQVLHRNDPELRQETSNSYTLSVNYSNSDAKWQYQALAEGFYTKLMNPFANEYGTPDENGIVVYTRTNAEKGAIVRGVNLEFNASPSNRWQLQSGFTIQKSMYEEPQEFNERRFFRSPDSYGYLSLNFSPTMKFNLSATGNYTGSMLVPYFGPRLEDPASGNLQRSKQFFDAGIKAAYIIRLTDQLKLEWNAGAKNIFNSYQSDFDSGIDRDPGYIYGPVTPLTIYTGIRIGSML